MAQNSVVRRKVSPKTVSMTALRESTAGTLVLV